jgi:acetyl/propionyl-CoA carboxylase alpha subunit
VRAAAVLVRAPRPAPGGAPLPWTQADLSQRGHAIECRVYAEDPRQQFLPQAGKLLLYREPYGPGIRVDGGVQQGDDVSVHYDPLLAKLVTRGESRDAAIDRAIAALKQFAILGLRSNVAFLIRVLQHPRFRAGDIDTGFLDAELPSLVSPKSSSAPATPSATTPSATSTASAISNSLKAEPPTRMQAAVAAAAWRVAQPRGRGPGAAASLGASNGAGPGDEAAMAVPPDPWESLEGWRG